MAETTWLLRFQNIKWWVPSGASSLASMLLHFGMGMQSRQRDTYARYWKTPLMLHNHHSRSVTQTTARERLSTSRILLFKKTFFLRLKPLLLNGNTKKKRVTNNLKHTIGEWIHFFPSVGCTKKKIARVPMSYWCKSLMAHSFILYGSRVTLRWPNGDPYV